MQITLTELKQGINRLRTKGGANPENLYDLLNGYVTTSGTVVSRGGTSVKTVLPFGTKGMCVFEGKLHVFHATSSTGSNADVTVTILRHPDNLAVDLKEIHFAQPYLKQIYVVAEYTNGDVYHFWIQSTKTWTADTVYKDGDVVQPTVPDGYSYKAKRIDTANQVWAKSVLRAVTDVVEPTTPSGYKHTVIAVEGTKPSSGLTEPTWAITDGGITIEYSDGTGTVATPVEVGETSGAGSGTTVPEETSDRYDNSGGSRSIATESF